MTEEEYIELCAESAREEARFNLKSKYFIKPYQKVIDSFIPNNMSKKDFIRIRKQMGEDI